ncbi:MAG: TonB family protein [Bacteroidota bacterium]
MLKALFVFAFGIVILQEAKAQKAKQTDTLIYFIRNERDVVATKDSADYVLFILPNDPADKKSLYPVMEFYLNGKRKLIAASRTKSMNLVLEGPRMSFYPDGHRENIITYKNGRVAGNITEYYPNGKLYTFKSYDEKKKELLYMECRDSTGVILAENGSGKWLEFDEDFKFAIKQIIVKDGILIDKWQPVIDTVAESLYDNTGQPLAIVDVYPMYKGGFSGLGFFVNKNLDYPADDIKNDAKGVVKVNLIVEKNGMLTHFKVLSAASTTLGEEAIRLLRLSAPWMPGAIAKENPPSRVQLTVRLFFYLDKTDKGYVSRSADVAYYYNELSDNAFKATADTNKSTGIFSKVEKQPEFPGGLEAFGKFLASRIQYPYSDARNGVSGKVIVSFIVEKDGNLSNIKAIRGPSESMAREAVRVMKLSPHWSPGYQDGKPVRVNYTVPIAFALGEDPSKQ